MNKIAMYSTSKLFGKRVTGGLKRFLELYYGLTDNGYMVDLYSSDNQEMLDRKNINGYSLSQSRGVKTVFIPEELKIMSKNISVIRKIKKKKYDKIIVFDVPTAFSLVIAGCKHIQLFIRQDLIGYKRISLQKRINNIYFIMIYIQLMKLIEFFCLLRADKIFVQCEYDLHQLVERHKIIKKLIKNKTVVQINNVNPKWIETASANNRNKKMLDKKLMKILNSKKFVIGFIGDFSSDRKGQRIFVDAMKSLLNKNINVGAVIMGDGYQLDAYITECQEYKNIIFLGRVNNPIDIIRKCDLVVVPSLADSCPNTVMESIYNEIPVIGSSSGGIPEILVNPEHLFQPTAKALEEIIIRMLNPETIEIIRDKQKKLKEDLTFNWSYKIIKLLEI